MSIYNIISEDIKNNDINRVSTITVGVVTDINDPEKLGRVKVKLLNRTTSNYETDFIRVMTPMSGANWGAFFFPEVGDEVLVAFCDGDILKSYVLGSLWNEKRKPPVELKNKKNDIREIKTKSGHSIIFDDGKGEEKITLVTSKGLNLSLEDKGETITLSDKNNKNKIIIDSKKGSISVQASKRIELSTNSAKLILNGSSGSAELKSGNSLKIDSNRLELQGKSAAEMNSTGQTTVKSSGMTNIKGSIVKIN